jgi:hypothetical protein
VRILLLNRNLRLMSETNAENRQSYASLHPAHDNSAAKARGDAPAQSTPAEPDYLIAEADKLESFKQALFAAFLAAPRSGIPTALVDLAATYTSMLRTQMTLRGFSAVPTKSAKAPMFGVNRR